MSRKYPIRTLAILILFCFSALPFMALLSSGGAVLAPYLEISSPAQEETIHPDFEISYVASDDSPFRVSIFLDGVLHADDISTPFPMHGLSDGSHTITLRAINSYGLSTLRSIRVQVDGSAPQLEFINPVEGEVISSDEMLLQWTISDYSPVILLLHVDDEEAVEVSGLTQWPLIGLFEGPHSVRLQAEDIIGNSGQIEVNFTVQTGRPILLFSSPERNSHHPGPDIRVEWFVYPISATVEYRLDGGSWMAGSVDGVDLIGLDEGRHSVTVNVSDGPSHTERSLSFYIDSTGPQLRIVSPLMNMSFGGRSALLMWEVQEFSPYTVTLQVDSQAPFAVSGDSHIVNSLGAGNHTVRVNVTDAAGHSMEQNVTFSSQVPSSPRGPISISGDASMISAAQLFGLPGDGSETDPFILQNVGIDAFGGLYALSVISTSLHLHIQDCLFYNTSLSSGNEAVGKAIYLRDVRHMSINRSIARGQDHGIYQQSFSANLQITDNDFSHSRISGITMNQVDDVAITGNDLSHSGNWALMVGWKTTVSRSLLVSDNDCSDHQIYGIALERLESSNVSGNDVRSDSERSTNGIYLYGGTANTLIHDNDCRNNTYGIKISDYSTANLVLENDCRNNPYGIHLERAVANHITANNCSQDLNSDGYGIYLSYGHDNVVNENDCRLNLIGIFANHTAYGESILDNYCQDSMLHGILLSGSLHTFIITGNNCSDSGLDAIRLQSEYGAIGNLIQNNDCRHNGASAINISVDGNFISNRLVQNDCRDSPGDMIHIEGSDFSHNDFRGNNLEDALFLPINLNSSTRIFNETTVQDNLISRSGTYAFYIHGELNGLYVHGNQADNASLTAVEISSSNPWMQGVYVDGNDVSNSGGDGVLIEAALIVNGSVSGNHALNIPRTPVSVNSSSLTNFRVDANYCPHHPRAPLHLSASTFTDVSISENHLAHSGAGLILLQREFHNVRISENYLRHTPGALIHLQSDSSASGLEIDGNDLIRVGGSGIWVEIAGSLYASSFSDNALNLLFDHPLRINSTGLYDVSVDGNSCPDARDNGLNITANAVHCLSVSGNELQDSNGYGFSLSSNSISDLYINGNDMRRSNGDSIFIYSPSAIAGLQIRQNLLQQNGGNAIYLSSAQSMSSVLIGENNCTDSPHYPILIRAPITNILLIRANQLYDAPDRPLWLDCDDMNQITISDNIAYGSGAFGLELNGSSVRSINISGNDLRFSSLEPVNISSPHALHSIYVLNNLLQGASAHGLRVSTSAGIFDADVSGNNVTGHSQNQILLQCDHLQDSRVNGNRAHDSPALPLSIRAVSIDGLLIIANDFSRSGTHGIDLDSASMRNISVQQNDLRHSTGDALRMVASDSLESIHIILNDGREADGHGILLQNPSAIRLLNIIGNQFSLVQDTPISISTNRLEDARIESNICPDAVSTPLQMQVDHILGLTVVENDFNRSASHGVSVSAETIASMSINHNWINDAQGDAVLIVSRGSANLSDVRVWGNQAFNAAGNGSRVEASAICGLSIRDNVFRQAGGNGITLQVQDRLSALTVIGNDCRGAAADAFSLQSDSSNGSLTSAIIQDNLCNDNGRYGLFLRVPHMHEVRLEANNASASQRPLVLETDHVRSLHIIGNDFSSSSHEGIRLWADMQDVNIVDNRLLDSNSDAIYIRSTGTVNGLSIRGNDISSFNENGILIIASGLERIGIDSNHIISLGRHPISIAASVSQNLSINANNCSHSSMAPLHLQIDYHGFTSITDNDLSFSGDDGLGIDAVGIEGLYVSGNDLRSAAGDGIKVVSTAQMDDIDIRSNDLRHCPGTSIWVQTPAMIEGLQILDNIGGWGNGIVLQAQAWKGGNISGNLLQGSISVLLSADLEITHVDDNELTAGNFTLQGRSLSLQSCDRNEGTSFDMSSHSGPISIVSMDHNHISAGLGMISSDGVRIISFNDNDVDISVSIRAGRDVDINSFQENSVGPSGLDAVSMDGMNITVAEFNRNTLNAIGTGLDINASMDLILNHLIDNEISADRGIKIEALNLIGTEYSFNRIDAATDAISVKSQTLSLQCFCHNHFESGDQALSFNSSVIHISSIENNWMNGTGERLFHLRGEDVRIGSFSSNEVFTAPMLQAVNISAGQSLLVLQWGSNSLWGEVSLSSPAMEVDSMNSNLIEGNLSLEATALVLGDVDQNTLQALKVKASDLQSVSFTENTVHGAIAIEVSGQAVFGPVSGNSAHHFGVSALDIWVGPLAYNNISGDIDFLASGNISIADMQHNSAQDLLLHGSSIALESWSFNECSGDLIMHASFNISILELNGNSVRSMHFQSANLSILSLQQNVGQGHVAFHVSADALFGRVEGNDMGSFQALVDGDLQLLALENNRWNGTLRLQAAAVTVTEGISGNNITDGLSIFADSASIPSISSNLISAATGHGIDWQVAGSITVDISHNVINANVSNSGAGLLLQSASSIDLRFHDNQVTGFQQAALQIEASSKSATDITDCSLISNGHGLVSVADGIFLNISRSDISYNGGDAINLSARTVAIGSDNMSMVQNLRGLLAFNISQLSFQDCEVRTCPGGLVLEGANISIERSLFQGNGVAVRIGNSDGVRFVSNRVIDSNSEGLSLYDSFNITVQGNLFNRSEGYALQSSNCSNMDVMWNEFLGNNGAGSAYDVNHVQAYDDQSNQWSASRYPGSGGEEGNRWGDWLFPDQNEDGIVDHPYILDGGARDLFPLLTLDDRYPPYLLISSPLDGSKYRNGSISLEWVAADNRSGLSIYQTEILIDGSVRAELDVDESTYEIMVSTLSAGYHTISVRVRDNDANVWMESISVLIDRSPPLLVITAPAEGSISNQPFSVYWTVNDNYDLHPQVDIRADGGVWFTAVSTGYQFHSLSEGSHLIELRATDHLENEVIVHLNVTVDTVDPLIAIISPQADEMLNLSSVLLSWSVTDASPCAVSVSSDGVHWIEVSAAHHRFNLGEGECTLQVRAIDAAGNEAQEAVNFTVDTVPPWLSLISPLPNQISGLSTVLLQWTVIEANEWGAELALNDGPWFPIGHSTEHNFTGLADGENTFRVRVRDAAGHSSDAAVTVIVDTTPPLLTIVLPGEGARFNHSAISIRWSVQDISDCSYRVSHGSEGSISVVGTSHVFDLVDGLHTLYVQATDAAGWVSVAMVNITVDTTPPALIVDAPAAGGTVKSANVSVQWSTDGVRSMVSLDDGGFRDAVDNATYRFNLSGSHSVTVRSWDDLGNMAESTVDFLVSLTSMESWSPQGQEVSSGTIIITVRFNRELNESSLTVLLNSQPVTYTVEGVYLNISTVLDAGMEYGVIITGAGVDGSEIVDAQWSFASPAHNLGMAILLGASLASLGAAFMLARPRMRRF